MDEPPDESSAPGGTTMGNRADDSDWLASDDISVLRQLLQTPEPRSEESYRPWRVASEERTMGDGDGDEGSDEDDGEGKEGDTKVDANGIDHGLVITALQRQVHLLQQEYDRQLEQSVARSVVKAGGKSAPRAATIKLYRNYQRLARVAQELVTENERLLLLLRTRQRNQTHWLQRAQGLQLQRPFQAVRSEGVQEISQTEMGPERSPMSDEAAGEDSPRHQLNYNEDTIP